MKITTLQTNYGKYEQHKSFALLTITQHLIDHYSTSLIPYLVVAKDYLGYQTDKTAKTKLHDGTLEKLGLMTTTAYSGRKAPVFVKAIDLAHYLILHGHVEISHL
jgi:hypothetical protein